MFPMAMQEKRLGLRRFLQTWIITTLAVLVAVNVLPGLRFTDDSLLTPFVASLVLGILNAFIRPIMMLVALPLLVFTLGLFTLVINALLLYFVAWLLPTFEIDGFGWAFLGSLIISVVSVALNILTGRGNARLTFHQRQRPPDSDRKDGNGPVIDV